MSQHPAWRHRCRWRGCAINAINATYAIYAINAINRYDFFLTHDFTWDNGNIDALINEIPDHEQGTFRVGTRDLNWYS